MNTASIQSKRLARTERHALPARDARLPVRNHPWIGRLAVVFELQHSLKTRIHTAAAAETTITIYANSHGDP